MTIPDMSTRVIKIIDTDFGDLTVDNDIITVDSTLITVDTTLVTNTYTIKIAPDFFTDIVILNLYNELQDTIESVDGVAVINGNFTDVTFEYSFLDGDSFETEVTDLNGNRMWRGKLYATTQTDLQNYTL